MIQQLHFCIYAQRTESRDSNRYLHTQVHSIIIYNSQKMETTQMSMDEWINKMQSIHRMQ